MSSDSKGKLERFGKYLILDHLVDGGMASICRARYLGEQADKIVAIKMVQPQYSKDESFKTMFMDEIKVTFGLIHPNIAQTYDYGIHSEQLYTAMEYVDGKNLKEYLDKLKERKFVFPVEISVFIISQVCQGLHYAHTLTDKLSGKQVNIIHRDISPHNIMLTYDGAVKVIDFGIAKAETNSEATQAGTIKGKLSYLAPEYLEGNDLDPRYDEFAVGITLWEMLCSRKLFKAKNDLAVLKQIQACKVPPPSSINPNVPKELDQIVLRALSRDPAKRYDDLDQLNRALIKFLYANYPDFNSSDLSFFAGELFKEVIETDRQKMFEFGKIDIAAYLEDLKREQEGGGGTTTTSTNDEKSDLEPTRKKAMVLDFGFENDDEKAEKTSVRRSRTRVNMKRPVIPTPAAEEGTSESQKKSSVEATKARSDTPVRQTVARKKPTPVEKAPIKEDVTQDDIPVPRIPKSKSKLPRVFVLLGIVVVTIFLFKGIFSGDEEVEKVVENSSAVDNPVEKGQEEETQDSMVEEGTGLIEFTNFSRHQHRLFINGERADVSVLGEVEWSYGEQAILRIQKQGHEHFVRKILLGSSAPNMEITIPDMPATGYAFLVTNGFCLTGSLSFTLFDEERVEAIPIEGRGIAFPVGIAETGESIPQTFTVFYKREFEDIQRKLVFSTQKNNDTIDLCNLIGEAEK